MFTLLERPCNRLGAPADILVSVGRLATGACRLWIFPETGRDFVMTRTLPRVPRIAALFAAFALASVSVAALLGTALAGHEADHTVVPDALTFAAVEGGTNPDPQTVAYGTTSPNCAKGDLVAEDAGDGWLHVDPHSFNPSADFPLVLTVSVDVAGLTAAGSPYAGTITIDTASPQFCDPGPTVAVTLTVSAASVDATITSTAPAALTETNLDGATVTVDITDGTYDATLFTTDFTLGRTVPGVSVAGVVRNDADTATLTLAYDDTDFDVLQMLNVTVAQSALATGTGPATTGSAVVTAILEATITASLVSTTPAALTETNLDGATVTVDITDGTYDVTLFTTDFTLGGTVPGVSVAGVVRNDADTATLTLAYDDTDFDVLQTLNVTVAQSALATGTGPATTGSAVVTAILEATITASLVSTAPAALTETNLDGATVTVDITDGTYDATLFTTDFTLGGTVPGMSVAGVVRNDADTATLTLAYDDTDFDVLQTLNVTVAQGALATGTGPATTGSAVVTAILEATITASLVSTTSAALTETNLDGATVTVDITDGTYDVTLFITDFTLGGTVPGVSVAGVVRNDADTATLTLAYDDTDFDVLQTLNVTVAQSALATGTGPATTGSAVVTAEPISGQPVTDQQAQKTIICHIPPGNPDNDHMIAVGDPAVPAHLAHGDALGTCAPD